MPASDLYTACVAVLSTCAAALATTAAGTPGTAAVYPGNPPADCCPMLAVWWTPVSRPPAAPSGAALDSLHRNRAWLNLVQFNVRVLRCDARILDGSATPNVVDINAAAKQVADDAWALNSYMPRRVIDGTLLGPYPCEEVAFTPIQQLTPMGGVVGCEFQIQAVLQGYVS